MKTILIHLSALALLILSFGCDLPHNCEGLVYVEASNTCVCPEGSEPDYEVDACVWPNGDLIPWTGLPVPYLDDAGLVMDGGFDANELADMAATDVGPTPTDVGPDVVDVSDVGPPPPATTARFPWNGYMTGSVHVPASASVIDHPLRPRLIWEPAPSAGSYDVQMTRACSYTDFRDCDFARTDLDESVTATTFRPAESLPVSMSVPVGSRYFWRVRACNAEGCSDWTEVRYINVGRSHNDFNGDGYSDLAIGASGRDRGEPASGSVHVLLGGPAGVQDEVGTEFFGPVDEDGAWFGFEVTGAGDVNADGFSDFVVAAPQQDAPATNTGSVYLYLGGPDGPEQDASQSLPNPTNQAAANFGLGMAGPGDLNGDGFDDLAVGAYRQDFPETDEGVVFIFLGRETGLSRTAASTLDNPMNAENGRFGRAIAGVGDVNGDGLPDILVGAPNNPGGGQAYLFLGDSSSLPEEPSFAFANPSDQDSARFGASVAGTDANGDGFSDMVVGAPYQDLPMRNAGRVYVFMGGPHISALDPAEFDSPEPQEFGGFGSALASGFDVNGDGRADMLVAASGQNSPESNEGVAFLFMSSDSPELFDNPKDQTEGYFGSRLSAIGDLNGDGFEDMCITAPQMHTPEQWGGGAYIFLGNPGRISPAPDISLDNPRHHVQDHFGSGVAIVTTSADTQLG